VYRQNIYFQTSKPKKKFVASRASGEPDPPWNAAQSLQRHGDMRGLTSGRALNRRGTIHAAWNELIESEPSVNGRIQADAKECLRESIRICWQVIHSPRIFRTMESRMPGFR